jgi:pimeloyl-ACP methyl ester carboxylesterase
MNFNQLDFVNKLGFIYRMFIKVNCVRKSLLRLLIVLFCHILLGCSIANDIKYPKNFDYKEDFVYKEIQTDYFTIAVWQKTGLSSNSKYNSKYNPEYIIYIEGDGNSFNSRGYPTLNPTPKDSKLKKLAFKSKSDNVIYMARPCQFVKDKKCNQSYWTATRFSKEVIDSMSQAIKSIIEDNEVILVGYSGGAQVSGLIAVGDYNINITKLITIAGNLDHKSWTNHHKISKLSGSLDLNDYKEEYLKIPQIHYVGERDKVVPSFLTEKFVEKSRTIEKSEVLIKENNIPIKMDSIKNNNISIVKIPKAGHVDILDKINL